MKRTVSVILALLLLLAGCGKKKADPNGKIGKNGEGILKLPAGIIAENTQDFVFEDGKLWILSCGEVKTAGTGEATLPVPDGFVPAFLAADGENPVLCAEDGRIFWDGELLPAAEKDMTVTSFAVAGDTAVAAYQYTWLDQKGIPWMDGQRLAFYNRATGTSITLDPIAEGIARVAACDGTHVWVFNCDPFYGEIAYRVDIVTMKEDLPYRTGSYAADFAWNAAEELLYFTVEVTRGEKLVRNMKAYDPESGKAFSLSFPEEIGVDTKKFGFVGDMLVVLGEGGTVTLSNLSDAFPDPETDERAVTMLVIESTDPYSTPPSEITTEKLAPLAEYAGITLTVKGITRDQLSVKLLAGEDDFDIFPNYPGFNPANPVWEPLEPFDAVREQADKLLPEAYELFSYDGHLMGVPTSANMYQTFSAVRTSTMEAMGLSKEYFDEIGATDGTWTLDDFYDLALLAKESGFRISRGDGVTLDNFVFTFFGADGTGGGKGEDELGEAIRKFLLHRKRMEDGDLLAWGKPEYEESTLLYVYYQKGDFRYAVEKGEIMAWEPTVDGTRNYYIEPGFAMMNPNSKHKQAAAEVLGIMLDPEGGYTDFARGKSDLWLYRDAENYMTTDAAKENWANYREAMQYFRAFIPATDGWYSYAEEEMRKYIADEQDLEYTVERILDRAKMVLEG